jgi:DNA modification methylase
MAAMETGRNSVGVEIEPVYIELAAERLRQSKLGAKVEIEQKAIVRTRRAAQA